MYKIDKLMYKRVIWNNDGWSDKSLMIFSFYYENLRYTDVSDCNLSWASERCESIPYANERDGARPIRRSERSQGEPNARRDKIAAGSEWTKYPVYYYLGYFV